MRAGPVGVLGVIVILDSNPSGYFSLSGKNANHEEWALKGLPMLIALPPECCFGQVWFPIQ